MEHSRRRWQIGILVSVFLSLSVLLGSQLFAQESLNLSAEFRIAHGYFEQAKVLYRDRKYGPAAELLEASLEFFPGYSESSYLCARVYLREQETTWRAIECLEAAVKSDTWTETEPLVGAAELIRAYVRTARFQESRRLFAEIGQTGLGGRGNPDLSALWARTLVGLGRLDEAQSFLSGALRRFPQSPQIYALLAELLSRQGQRTAAAEVLQRGINEIPTETELMYRLAVLERDSQKRRELVEAYFQAGGSDPAAALLAIKDGGGERERFVDLFFRLGGNGRIGYLDELRELVPGQEISGRTEGYSGTRIRDLDRDGYYEQKFEYREGTLVRWISDQDQNGIAEAIVDFEERLPRKVTLPRGGGSGELQYLYGEYPFVESASLVSGTSLREYRMVPYALRLPAFVAIPTERFALELQADLKLDEDSIRNNAYQAVDYLIDKDLHERRTRRMRSIRRTYLLEGRTVRIDELPDSAGHFTHTLFYSGSLPVEGIRDLDGDGEPEIREQFRNGRVWKITLDQDGDGVNEFEQIFKGDLKQMYWDYNDDGLYDSREFQSFDGTVVRGFSSLLNGTYDLIDSREDLP